MPPRSPFSGSIDKAAWQRSLRRLRQAAERADRYGDGALSDLTRRARDMRPLIDRIEAAAAQRFETDTAEPPTPRNLPPRTEWVWRPEICTRRLSPGAWPGYASGVRVGDSIGLFHDCPWQEITAKQYRADDGWGLSLDWTGFSGSYLSAVLTLPETGIEGLKDIHVISLRGIFNSERGGYCFMRLNIRHGPNIAQIKQVMESDTGLQVADFDLAYATFVPEQVTEVWIDILFEGKPANRLTLEDILVSRHRRSQL